ncbi:MAG: Alpha amylase, catalytic region, partial [Acidobacteria bacterium]|nr:Alpha amylase, catalytic region [Acidobacteriota bacterium]
MQPWPKSPVIYEINTWVWLNELSARHGRRLGLGSVPPGEWDALAGLGVDAIWLMGVWERSPAGIEVALRDEGLVADFRRALPDLAPDDVVGSPYCVRRYVVDRRLGGPEGLATARRMLRERGLRLLLDFVPNHVAPDHPWVREHPEYFIR